MLNNEFISQIGHLSPMYTAFNVEDEFEEEINSYLKNYCSNINNDMQYNSKESFIKEFQSLQMSFKSVGMALSTIMGFIGIMNFVNTIITSIISRRREFAMLQSIGMTRKQLNYMLICEGVFYIILTTLFVMTIGMVISYFGTCIVAGSVWFFKFKFNIIPIIVYLPILYIIAIILPLICSNVFNKESIVERLREIE